MINTLFIVGTRPEAIKLAPVIHCLKEHADIFRVRVCVTAQHRQMLDQVLNVFGIVPDYDLDVMRPGQTLAKSTTRILAKLEPILQQTAPDLVIVQGDTTTTLCGGIAGFYAGTPVAHVEAGLRTSDLQQPFPEEFNRVVVDRLATMHFPATQAAADNLLAEGVAKTAIHVTGNSGIDAVLYVNRQLEEGALVGREWSVIDNSSKLILVTAHRRESFGAGFERICAALARLSERGDVQLIYPVHPNPSVAGPVFERLGSRPRIYLTEPLDYVDFVDLMRRAYLILSDSGGIQEEAPSLGKPVLVLRNKTERPEAIEAGTAELVGSNVDRILAAVSRLLDDPAEYARRSAIRNPYGDGHASQRIAAAIAEYFGMQVEPNGRMLAPSSAFYPGS